jgi:tripartite-type tricarboxylate transporter receptor subunit TctC
MFKFILATVLLLSSICQAQTRLVVPYVPGGVSDRLARAVAQEVNIELGRNYLIVENRPGAGGTVSADYVKASKTPMLYIISSGFFISQHESSVNYSSKDFRPVFAIGRIPMILLKSPDSYFNLQSNRNVVFTAGHAGRGTTAWFAASLLRKHYPFIELIGYKGTADTYPDLIANRINLTFDFPGGTDAFISSGMLEPVAVTSMRRLKDYPNVPTLVETFKDPTLVIHGSHMIVANQAMSASQLQTINRHIQRATARQDFVRYIEQNHINFVGGNPANANSFYYKEDAYWKNTVKAIQ